MFRRGLPIFFFHSGTGPQCAQRLKEGVKSECADYISRNDFDDLIGTRSEALAKEAFSRMDVRLDLNMTMIRRLDGLQQAEYLKEFGDI